MQKKELGWRDSYRKNIGERHTGIIFGVPFDLSCS